MVVRSALASLLAAFAMLGRPGAVLAEATLRPELVEVWVDPVRDLAPDAVEASISHILFINRCPGDCVVTPGANDARSNTSSLVQTTSTLSEFRLGDEAFAQIVDCVRDVYSPYDVEVVTEDPGSSVFHHEAMLAGTPDEAGFMPTTGGVAPASCEPLNNVISFSFANRQDSDVESMCWTVAQESAHAFGLPNHVYDCHDPMTYLDQNCGRKYFRNRAIACGEFEPGRPPCSCGVSEQNSHAELLKTFGPGTPPAPPGVALLYPEADAAVEDEFSIFFTALDPRLVHHVDIYLNGTKYKTLDGYDYVKREDNYSLKAPPHPDGYIDLEIKAYNEINTEAGTASETVLKGAPCSSADQCFEFMSCNEGRCTYPAPSGRLGDECGYDQFCVNGPCTELDGERRCSQSCNPSVADACPQGYDCLSTGLCWPASEGGGCRAAAGGTRPDERFPLAVLSALFTGAVLLVRRSRRSRRSA